MNRVQILSLNKIKQSVDLLGDFFHKSESLLQISKQNPDIITVQAII